MSVSAAERQIPEPMAPAPWRILDVRREVADGEVFTWRLRPESGAAPEARPGQFNMLYLFGVGEVAISVSAMDGDGSLVHTIRAVGSVTRTMQGLRAGDVVGVRGPFGSAWPVEAAEGATWYWLQAASAWRLCAR